MLRRKDPQDLGWMCGVREREGAGKFLIPGLDNLGNDYVIHNDRKLRGETKPRGGRFLGEDEKL